MSFRILSTSLSRISNPGLNGRWLSSFILLQSTAINSLLQSKWIKKTATLDRVAAVRSLSVCVWISAYVRVRVYITCEPSMSNPDKTTNEDKKVMEVLKLGSKGRATWAVSSVTHKASNGHWVESEESDGWGKNTTQYITWQSYRCYRLVRRGGGQINN